MISKCAFIIPVYIETSDKSKLHFFEITLNSIFSQSSDDWTLIIIDDNSNNKELDDIIRQAETKVHNKIIYRKNKVNLGPGASRNIGIDIADELKCEFICYQDADDIAHPLRLETTKKIFDNKNIGVVYSPFIPIDEKGQVIEENSLSFSIRDILKANQTTKLSGKDVWKKIATETGYINMTSSTSVRIEYAKKVRFPNSRASEDAYTWMIYSALGAEFYFAEEIPCQYRIPQNVCGSSSRSYVGKEKFYEALCDTNEKAFFKSMEYAEKSGRISKNEKNKLISGFYKKLCETLDGEGMNIISSKLNQKCQIL